MVSVAERIHDDRAGVGLATSASLFDTAVEQFTIAADVIGLDDAMRELTRKR